MTNCDGVVLAAGLSRRAGCPKLELPMGGRTVIEHSVASLAAFCDRVIVVVGWRAERVRDLLTGVEGVHCVLNEAYEEGMFSSVRVGLAHVRAGRFLLLPGDQPMTRPETIRRLLAAEGEIVIPSFRGRKGHPVRIDSRAIPDILAEPPTGTLRDCIARRGYTTVEVDDPGIHQDIDTLADYDALQGAGGGEGR
jgi:molybdenum cofactor cytidylyltransferase